MLVKLLVCQNVLETRNSELHSLEELRSQFGQFRESVLKELRPVSSPPIPQASGSIASSSHDASAVLPQAILPPALETDGIGLDPLHTTQNDAGSSALNSDEDIDGAHAPSVHESDSRVRTPQRYSPSSHVVAQTLSPAEAGKQAHVIEKERDALLSSGLYHENGEKYVITRITQNCHSIFADPLISALEAKIRQLLAVSQANSSS